MSNLSIYDIIKAINTGVIRLKLNKGENMAKSENKKEQEVQKLKLFPLITGGVSLLVMILLCVLPRGFGETLNVFIVPAVAISFILLGIYLIRNLKKYLNLLGIVAIVFGVLAYPIMANSLVFDIGGGFFKFLVMQFVPFTNGTICVWELLNFVLDGFMITADTALLYNAAMSTTLYVGGLVYLFFPASKILKNKQELVDKDSPLRFYICMFSAVTAVLVVLILIIWGVCALISKMLGGSESNQGNVASADVSNSVQEKLVMVDTVGAVCLEVRERGEVYNVRTSNEFVGYYRDNRIYDEKSKEIGFIGTNNEICFLDAKNKGKFGEFSALYLKIVK